ncbi:MULTISPECIES: hypothetical protein [unclassified Clostridium]|uniref:hypothetical protein n=1 Tax=unclassified Clostridium TaxID=2614128 RepID=UPI0032180458
MKKENIINDPIYEFNSEEDLEELNGICEDITGIPISSFNFEKDTPSKENLSTANLTSLPPYVDSFTYNRKVKTEASGITPPIDGEFFDTQRCYKIRNSTARMLNEIKAVHPNVNVYMNTIVDAAIRNYYDFIFNKDGINTLW